MRGSWRPCWPTEASRWPRRSIEDRRLSERTDAEHSEALAEYGFVIVVPELSAEDEEAMTERLQRVHEKIDAVYAQHAAATHGSGVASDW